jgi:Rod binding domain-containing protein
MTELVSPLQNLGYEGLTLKDIRAADTLPADNDKNDPKIMQAAKDFEAAFISQMLKYSGLGEALTKNGGEDVQAFTDFYIENFAERIVEKGGFGLADKFYDKIAAKETAQLESVLNVKS